MIIHWRGNLNSVQNAVGYMIAPTMPMFFSGPSAIVLTLDVGDTLDIFDSIVPVRVLTLSDVLSISDSMRMDIPNWLRRVRIDSNLFEVILLRTSGARMYKDDNVYFIKILKVD